MDLKTVLDDAVRMVNYIKSRPLQARFFSLLCEEIVVNTTSIYYIPRSAGSHAALPVTRYRPIITFYDSIGTRTFGRSHVPIAI